MAIGSFAGIVFEVSADKILTLSDLSRSGGSRWSVHEINGKKPMPEFIGPGQEGISFKIILKAAHGVNPEKNLEILRKFRDTGQVSSFVLGSKPITSGYWYLEDINEGYKQVDNKGRVLSMDVSLTVKEYPKPVEIRSKPSAKDDKNKNTGMAGKYIGNVTIKVNKLNCRMSPSLKGKVKSVLRKNKVYKCYGKVKTDIEWWVLGKGLYVSANSKYTSFRKVETGSVSVSPRIPAETGSVGASPRQKN